MMHHLTRAARTAVALLAFALIRLPITAADAVPPLVNYQGRLTDDAGIALPNGTYRVAFRLWNRAAPRADGEQLIWGREYDLALLNGNFHVILGAPGATTPADDPPAAVNDLAFAFGDPDRYFGLTLTRTPSGPVAVPRELVPRQQLLSAPFALAAENAQNARMAASVAPGSVTSESIRTNSIEAIHLKPATLDFTRLAPRAAGTNTAGVGGIAFSPSSGSPRASSSTFTDIPNLTVTLATTGRPVLIMTSGVPGAESHFFYNEDDTHGGSDVIVRLLRDGEPIGDHVVGDRSGSVNCLAYPPSSFQFIDLPEAGAGHVYQLQWRVKSGPTAISHFVAYDIRLIAFEL